MRILCHHRIGQASLPLVAVLAMSLSACGGRQSDAELCADAKAAATEALAEMIKPQHVAACRNLAATGDATALNLLGGLFQLGIGVNADARKAMDFYSEAAKNGYSKAYFNVALLHLNGADGIPQDVHKALQYFEQALAAGVTKAEGSIGALYYYGDNAVPRDVDKALVHLNRAAAAEDSYAKMVLGAALTENDGVPPDPVRARRLMQEATQSANERLPMAFIMLGDFLRDGVGGPTDRSAARDHYEKALAMGHPEAAARLATLDPKEQKQPSGNGFAALADRAQKSVNATVSSLSTAPLVRGVSIETCEMHDIRDCRAAFDRIDCLFTNKSRVTVSSSSFDAWFFDSQGIRLDQQTLSGGDISPGQTIHVRIYPKLNTKTAVICSMDPQSELVLKDHIRAVGTT